MPTPFEVVADIRHGRFFLGRDLAADVRHDLDEHMGEYHAAVEVLARDLYTKDTHFVLELIQNAEDNAYPVGVTPTVRFQITSDCITVTNNESGFQEENVRALCKVGRSTKKKAYGYIGEKGIGFKSVFKVTDEPRIFSNGYRFGFTSSEEAGAPGFVVPTWIDEMPVGLDPGVTSIVLPLKSKIAVPELSLLEEIRPTLLLFLKKLRHVEVNDSLKSTQLRISRHDTARYVVLGEKSVGPSDSRESRSRFLVVRHARMRPADLEEPKREGVVETEVVLAFPVDRKGKPVAEPTQDLFAFLPVRSYGFKFVIHGDFLLVSSREEVHKTSGWNEWIRTGIAPAFLDALSAFKSEPALADRYFAYIPVAEEVADTFFQPVVAEIQRALSSADSVRSHSGKWTLPGQLLIPDESCLSVIGNSDLLNLVGKEYVSAEATAHRRILQVLGARPFSVSDIIECLRHEEWVTRQDDAWFFRLFLYLAKNHRKGDLEALGTAKLLRLESGEIVAPDEHDPVYLPLERATTYGFESTFRVLKAECVRSSFPDDVKVVLRFLESLHVHRATPAEIIDRRILPLYESDQWSKLKGESLLGHLRYIHDHFDSYAIQNEEGVKRVQTSLRIRISDPDPKRGLYGTPDELYMPSAYGNENSLESLFRGLSDVYFVHDQYVQAGGSAESWRRVLRALGVAEVPRVIAKTYGNYSIPDRLRDLGLPDANKDGRTGDDWCASPELRRLLQTADASKAEAVLRMVDRNWTGFYARFSEATIESYYRGRQSKAYPSTFLHDLRQLEVDTSVGKTAIEQTFLNTAAIREVLGDSIPYLGIELSDAALIKALLITTEVDSATGLKRLRQLAAAGVKDVKAYQGLYRLLSVHGGRGIRWDSSGLAQMFRDEQLVYIPNSPSDFYASKDVCWLDYGSVIGKHKPSLQKHYRDLESFFIEQLKVSRGLSTEELADVLRDLAKLEELGPDEKAAISRIYHEFNKVVGTQSTAYEHYQDIQTFQKVIREPVFWTDKQEFWENEGDLFVNDDASLYELFRGRPKIAFLDLPQTDLPALSEFIRHSRLPRLSSAKREVVLRAEAVVDAGLTGTLRSMVLYVARFLFHSDYKLYERLVRDHRWTAAASIQCAVAPELIVRYSIGGVTAEDARSAILNGTMLYVDEEGRDDMDRIAAEFARVFNAPAGLQDFLCLLLERKDRSKIERLFATRNMLALPPEEIDRLAPSGAPDHTPPVPRTSAVVVAATGQDGVRSSVVDPPPAPGPACPTNAGPTTQEKPVGVVSAPRSVREVDSPPGETTPAVQDAGSRGNEPTAMPSHGMELPQRPQEPILDWEPEVEPEQAAHCQEQPAKAVGRSRRSAAARASPLEPADAARTTLEPDEPVEVMSNEARKKIGNWGERWMFKTQLRRRFEAQYPEAEAVTFDDHFEMYLNGQCIVRVQWLNAQGDRHNHYDLFVQHQGVVEYIEVKSTHDDAITWFNVSGAQWEFARSVGEKFRIYRVSEVGKAQPQVKLIVNPVGAWADGELYGHPIRVEL